LEEHKAIAARLKLPRNVKERSLQLLQEVTLAGKKLRSVGVAGIYAAARLKGSRIS